MESKNDNDRVKLNSSEESVTLPIKMYSKVILNKCIVNKGTEDEFSCSGYCRNYVKTLLYYLLGIATGGFCFLLGYWNPVQLLKFTHKPCALSNASSVLVEQIDERQFVSNVVVLDVGTHSSRYDSTVDDSKLDVCPFEQELISMGKMIVFQHMFLTYYWDPALYTFNELSGLENKLSVQDIYKLSQGISESTRIVKRLLYGLNQITVPIKPFLLLFVQMAADPFYIFQAFSCALWFVDDYAEYSGAILAISLLSLFISTYETRKHLKTLQKMVAKSCPVQVLQRKDDESVVISKSSSELVPGDILVIPPEGMDMQCDAVLLSGRVIVNESALTGESFPTTKTPLDNVNIAKDQLFETLYSIKEHKRHSIYNGTHIVQARFYGGDARILAMVIRTGFCSLKGRLIRSILHPKPVHFQFFRDSFKFIMILFLLAIGGFIYSVVIFVQWGESKAMIVKKALDVITLIIPPALPTAMAIGIVYALRRLKAHDIYCIDPPRINVCGKIKMFVFDKTGTLTEDSLAVSSVLPVEDGKFNKEACKVEDLGNSAILKGMSTCHSITIINDNYAGDPLDLFMFNFTKWILEEPSDKEGTKFELLTPTTVRPPPGIHAHFEPDSPSEEQQDNKEIGILKQYPFESNLQRMSVITKELWSNKTVIYCKGAPEMLLKFCRPESIPADFDDVLMGYTETGHRVLALAGRELVGKFPWHKIQKLPRDEAEKDLDFLGLVVFENVIKDDSLSTIELLRHSNIRSIMATGDNLQTAVSVAAECGIIQAKQKIIELSFKEDILCYKVMRDRSIEEKGVLTQPLYDAKIRQPSKETERIRQLFACDFSSLDYCLALTGTTYVAIKEKYEDLVPKVLLSAAVFARMSPNQKAYVIEDLKELGYGVGMCGDGANDCGALKAAHTGIALSETEASAASPFTSKVFNISCVPRLIREGRCSLVTNFTNFKYMALYSLVQFASVLILYSVKSNCSDYQFIYVDVALIIPMVPVIVQSHSYGQLSRRRPPGRLVHPIFICSIVLQMLITVAFMLAVFFYARTRPWYKPPSAFDNSEHALYWVCYENLAVFCMSAFQYIWLAAICSSGPPYRESLYCNVNFIFVFIMTLGVTAFLTVHPVNSIARTLSFAVSPNHEFTLLLLAMAVCCGITQYLIEKKVMEWDCVKAFFNLLRGKKEPKNRYKHVFASIMYDQTWPPRR